jgi:hypothetical protein
MRGAPANGICSDMDEAQQGNAARNGAAVPRCLADGSLAIEPYTDQTTTGNSWHEHEDNHNLWFSRPNMLIRRPSGRWHAATAQPVSMKGKPAEKIPEKYAQLKNE